jgi:hypothetical protein
MLKKIDWYKVVGLCLLAWIGLSMAMIKEDGLRVRPGYLEGRMTVDPDGGTFTVENIGN